MVVPVVRLAGSFVHVIHDRNGTDEYFETHTSTTVSDLVRMIQAVVPGQAHFLCLNNFVIFPNNLITNDYFFLRISIQDLGFFSLSENLYDLKDSTNVTSQLIGVVINRNSSHLSKLPFPTFLIFYYIKVLKVNKITVILIQQDQDHI